MNPKKKLSRSMTLSQFDNGYWYTKELKELAQRIGIPSASKLRKDELEKAIKFFLQSGKIASPAKRNLSRPGVKDVERGLSLDLPVVVYTNDNETKSFLEREALKLAPGLKRRSGTRYRLNRWREEQLSKGLRLTYRSLVKKYIQLHDLKERFAKIPHGRYINFMSVFGFGDRGHERAGDSGLEEAEKTGRAQGLSFVGEIAIVETKVTVAWSQAHSGLHTISVELDGYKSAYAKIDSSTMGHRR